MNGPIDESRVYKPKVNSAEVPKVQDDGSKNANKESGYKSWVLKWHNLNIRVFMAQH